MEFLTDREKEVYQLIYKQASKICASDNLNSEKLFMSVLRVCDIMALSEHLINAGYDYMGAVLIIKSLIKKEILKEYTINGFPSFIPIGYQFINERGNTKVAMTNKKNYA